MLLYFKTTRKNSWYVIFSVFVQYTFFSFDILAHPKNTVCQNSPLHPIDFISSDEHKSQNWGLSSYLFMKTSQIQHGIVLYSKPFIWNSQCAMLFEMFPWPLKKSTSIIKKERI